MSRLEAVAAAAVFAALVAGCSGKKDDQPATAEQWGAIYATSPVVSVAYSPSYGVAFATPRETGFRYFNGSVWRHYLTHNAMLTSNDCRAVAVDKGGLAWIGTDMGISVFNGASFSWITNASTGGGLPGDSVRALFCDSGGRMWAGTDSGACYWSAQTGWVKFTTTLAALKVTAVSEDSSGNIWLGHDGFGCTRLRFAGGNDFYGTSAGMSSNVVNSISCDNSGLVWIGTPAGLNRFNGSSFTVYTTVSGLPSNLVRGVHADTAGGVWCATDQGMALFQTGLGSWTVWTKSNSSLPSDDLWCVAPEGFASAVWIGSGAGVTRFQPPSSFSNSGTGNAALPSNAVLSFAEDDLGNSWFGTDSGLTRVTGASWVTFDSSNSPDLKSNAIRGLAARGSDMWIATDTGLYRFDNVAWQVFDQLSGDLPTNLLRGLAFRGDDLWIATAAGLVRRDGAGVFQAFDSAVGLASNDVRAVACDAAAVWAATSAGLSRYDGTNWSTFSSSTSPATPSDSIADVEVVEGGVWVATADSGAAFYDGTAFTAYSSSSGKLPSDQVRSVCSSAQNVFLLTSKGLALFDGSSWKTYDEARSQLLSDDLTAGFTRKNGEFYFCTASAGVAVLRLP